MFIIGRYGQERLLIVLATSQYFLLLACRQVGLGKDFQKRLLIVLGTSFLCIACRQVETGKCAQGRLLMVLGTSQYFLSLACRGRTTW